MEKNDQILVCPYCNKQNSNKKHHDDHVRIHTGEKPFKCSRCDYAANQSANLSQHQKRYAQQPTSHCNFCSFKSCSSVGLTSHYKEMHSGESLSPLTLRLLKQGQAILSSDSFNNSPGKLVQQNVPTPSTSKIIPIPSPRKVPSALGGYYHELSSSETYQDLGPSFSLAAINVQEPSKFVQNNTEKLVNHQQSLQPRIVGNNKSSDVITIVRNHTPKGQKYHCPYCAFSCFKLADFDQHVQSRNDGESWICSKINCAFTCCSSVDFIRHAVVIHGIPKEVTLQNYPNIDPTTTEFSHGNPRQTEFNNEIEAEIFRSVQQPYQPSETFLNLRNPALRQPILISGPPKPSTNRSTPVPVIQNPVQNMIRGTSPYQCKYCKRTFKTSSHVKDHERIHTGERPYPCPHCSYAASTATILRAHLSSRSGPPKSCAFCSSTFCNDSLLNKHLADEHLSENDAQRSFSVENENASHEFNGPKRSLQLNSDVPDPASTIVKPFNCDRCSYQTDSESKLQVHVNARKSNHRVLRCKICAYTACFPIAMGKHRNTAHIGLSKELVSNPGKRPSVNNLKRSRNDVEHEEDEYDEDTDENSRNAKENQGKLQSNSGDGFSDEDDMQGDHLTNENIPEKSDTDGDDNPVYGCAYCDHFSMDMNEIKRHLSEHLGQRPYYCSFCRRRFTTRINLVNHERIHTGEQPYECSKCSKTFSQKCNLNTHMKTRHGIIVPGRKFKTSY